MLKQLVISNYALIENAEIQFTGGLTTITGETGAGKSILLGALGLVMGNRADTGVLRNKDSKCFVEATFHVVNYGLQNLFEKHDLDLLEDTIIRREINVSGASRAFVNDTPVNLTVLKEISSRLIDIHSQHDTLLLNNSTFQTRILDIAAGCTSMVKEYATLLKNYNHAKSDLDDLLSKEQQARLDHDFQKFLFDELQQADLVAEELETTESEIQALAHAEEIKSALASSAEALDGSESAALSLLRTARSGVATAARFSNDIKQLLERMDSIIIDVKDVASEVNDAAERTSFDPERLAKLNDRFDLLNTLLRKHRVQSIEDLITIKDQLDEKLYDVSSLEDKIEEKRKEVALTEESLKTLAAALSKARAKAVPFVEKEVVDVLHSLNMADAVLKISLQPSAAFKADGMDDVRFLFTANKGAELKELSKVASGGELGRVMLSIKNLLSKNEKLPTLIFDEIDTGVSGEVAGKMGSIMQTMGERMQVITITHLPQIAGKGNSHLYVYKDNSGAATTSMIKALTTEERVEEVARMLSGEKLSGAAIENAKELLA